MAGFDWAGTPLGDPDTWPQSLRTVVRILLTSRYAMWMGWGPELTFLYNDAYAAMTLGAKHPWALGRPSREVWAEIWPQIGPRIERVLTTGEATWDERLRLFLERSRYREETYHTFSYSPLPDDAGRVNGMLCVVTEETERVLDERRLATLGELGSQLAPARGDADVFAAVERAAARGAPDLPFLFVYLFDETGIARLTARGNVAAGEGMPAELPIAELAAACGLTAREGESAADAFAQACPCRTPEAARYLTSVWDTVPEQAIVAPLRLSGQQAPTGVLIAGLNPFRRLDERYENFVTLFTGQVAAGLTGARAYEEERRRAEGLAALDRAKTAFFSNISHEFRTPLTLMLGPTEDALATPGGVLAGEDLRTVHRNQQRLLRLVNALLDFSRVEAGRARARFEPIDLTAETAGLAALFRSAVERAGLRLEVDCAELGAPVYVDRMQWERIVLNLLSNALKFTFDGTITVRAWREADEAVVTVSDTGVGIPADALPRVFERFHRIEGTRSRTHEGSGIGLALVHELVQLHGGHVSAESEVGRGTTFTVRLRFGADHLPAEAVAEAPVATPGRTGAADAFVAEAERWLPAALDTTRVLEPPARTAAGRVLVVDDNADMRDYAARLLRAHWEVETAADGEDALAAARAQRPDLVLTDVMMPRLDGFGLLRALREDARTADVPVIMLSARAGDESRIDGLVAGADDYLVKPFSARELVARVATHLGLSQARRHAQQERDRLRALLGQIPAITNFLSGPDLVFEFVHPLAMKTLGGRDLLGKPVLEAIPEHRGQPFVEELLDTYRTGRIHAGRGARAEFDARGTGERDETFWDYTYLPVRNAAGEIEGVMTFDIDVTEQVRTQRSLERATRAKDEFLAMLGHELRNPLAPIQTALQLMELKGAASVAPERLVIERQTRHLARLVDDLLDVARIARGRIELKKEIVQIGDVVAKAIEVAAPLLETRRQRLDLRVPPAGLVVHADPERLAQAVANLLTNAAKYSEPATPIVVAARRDGADIVVSVRDQGLGIAADLLPRVFDLFVQGGQSSARSQGGLGLGLAIVRNIMELHGGTATVTSDGPGRGSEFVLRLPAGVAAPVADAVADAPAGPSPAGGLSVLIVDDNEDAAAMLTVFLELRGHRVRSASDGLTALRLLEEDPADVALLDIGLPGMDGYELAARIRGTGRLSGVRLVAVTGYGQASDRRKAEAAGFDAHLVKPVDTSVLERVLAEAPR